MNMSKACMARPALEVTKSQPGAERKPARQREQRKSVIKTVKRLVLIPAKKAPDLFSPKKDRGNDC